MSIWLVAISIQDVKTRPKVGLRLNSGEWVQRLLEKRRPEPDVIPKRRSYAPNSRRRVDMPLREKEACDLRLASIHSDEFETLPIECGKIN